MSKPSQDHLHPMWEHKEEVIQYVLDNFNFEKVHKFMKKVRWTYKPKGEKAVAPSIEDLKNTVKRVLRDQPGFCDEHYSSNCGTGGFQFEYSPGWLSIRFGYDRWWKLYKKQTIVAQATLKDLEVMVCRLDIGRPEIKPIKFKKSARCYGIKIGDYFVKNPKPYTKREAELIKTFLEDNYHRFNVHDGGL